MPRKLFSTHGRNFWGETQLNQNITRWAKKKNKSMKDRNDGNISLEDFYIYIYIWNLYLTRMPLKQGDTLDDLAVED